MHDADPITFRRFEPNDAAAVRALHVLALRHTGAFVETDDARKWDSDLEDIERAYIEPGGEFLVGLIAGEIVAMGALRLDGDGVATLKRMRVHPDHQRRGYGRELLRLLEADARSKGVARVVLDTLPIQGQALALYEVQRIRRDASRTA